jgi:hypothetical protein
MRLGPALVALLRTYWHGRHSALEHRGLAAGAGLAAAVVGVLAWRQSLILWSRLKAQVSGTAFRPAELSFPMRRVNFLRQLRRRPPEHTFVGLTPSRRLLGWRWTPVYLSARQRTTHRHVIGKTGSGKTSSVLWPQLLQDALDGKGVLVLSAKGSDEEVGTMKGIAALAGRQSQLRVFSLPAWSVPGRFSHTYNLLWVRPRTPEDAGGDVAAMAQRVFSVLSLGDNVFYRTKRRSSSRTSAGSSTASWTPTGTAFPSSSATSRCASRLWVLEPAGRGRWTSASRRRWTRRPRR